MPDGQEQAEKYAEQLREAMEKLADLTLGTSSIDAPDRILEPLTHALSNLPNVLNQLGAWHQTNTDRAGNPALAMRTALRLYERPTRPKASS